MNQSGNNRFISNMKPGEMRLSERVVERFLQIPIDIKRIIGTIAIFIAVFVIGLVVNPHKIPVVAAFQKLSADFDGPAIIINYPTYWIETEFEDSKLVLMDLFRSDSESIFHKALLRLGLYRRHLNILPNTKSLGISDLNGTLIAEINPGDARLIEQIRLSADKSRLVFRNDGSLNGVNISDPDEIFTIPVTGNLEDTTSTLHGRNSDSDFLLSGDGSHVLLFLITAEWPSQPGAVGRNAVYEVINIDSNSSVIRSNAITGNMIIPINLSLDWAHLVGDINYDGSLAAFIVEGKFPGIHVLDVDENTVEVIATDGPGYEWEICPRLIPSGEGMIYIACRRGENDRRFYNLMFTDFESWDEQVIYQDVFGSWAVDDSEGDLVAIPDIIFAGYDGTGWILVIKSGNLLEPDYIPDDPRIKYFNLCRLTLNPPEIEVINSMRAVNSPLENFILDDRILAKPLTHWEVFDLRNKGSRPVIFDVPEAWIVETVN